jgi:hypothetical protein
MKTDRSILGNNENWWVNTGPVSFHSLPVFTCQFSFFASIDLSVFILCQYLPIHFHSLPVYTCQFSFFARIYRSVFIQVNTGKEWKWTGKYWQRMKTNRSILAKIENWQVNTGKLIWWQELYVTFIGQFFSKFFFQSEIHNRKKIGVMGQIRLFLYMQSKFP